MEAFEEQLERVQNGSISSEEIKQIEKSLRAIPKDCEFELPIVNLVMSFLDQCLSTAGNSSTIILILELLTILTHYKSLTMGILNMATTECFDKIYTFEPTCSDPDRLIYVLIGFLSVDEYQNHAIPVLEGLSFYGPGKRKCIFCGIIDELDEILVEKEQEYADNFTLEHCYYLECLSNVIGSKEARLLQRTDGGFVMATMGCLRAVYNAVMSSRNTKQARCSVSCLFYLLLDNYMAFAESGMVSEDLFEKLLVISCTHHEKYGGRMASLSLLLLIANMIKPDTTAGELTHDKVMEQHDKERFGLFREYLEEFKEDERQTKQLHMLGELFDLLENTESYNSAYDDTVEDVVEEYQAQISELESFNERFIIQNELYELETNTSFTRCKSEFGGCKTTGNMRAGLVRTRARSSLDDW